MEEVPAQRWMALAFDTFSIVISLVTLLELTCRSQLPQVLKDAMEFGKVRAPNRVWTVVRLLEIPKRWFWHFYLSGLLSTGLLLAATHCRFDGVLSLLNYLASDLLAIPDLHGTPWLNYVPVGLQIVQMLRRMLECLLVSVYSPATMNLVHYALGCSFYFAVVYALLLRLPEYSISVTQAGLFTLVHATLAYNQHKVAQVFAALRKDRRGAVVHHRHSLPQGHLFKYLSSPHYNLEMLIYLNLFALTGCSTGSLLFHLLIMVLVNQTASALITHSWYRQQFGAKFPTGRKALIPFVL